MNETPPVLELARTWVVRPALGAAWWLMLFLFLLFLGKYLYTLWVTSRPTRLIKPGVSPAQAQKDYDQALSLYYDLDAMARPVVLALLLFLAMSYVLYRGLGIGFLDVLGEGAYVSCILLPFLYFYYGDASRFRF